MAPICDSSNAQLTHPARAAQDGGVIVHRPSAGWSDLARRADVAMLGSELRLEMTELRSELRGEMAELRIEMANTAAGLDRRMAAQTRVLLFGTSTTMLAGLSAVAALVH